MMRWADVASATALLDELFDNAEETSKRRDTSSRVTSPRSYALRICCRKSI